MPKVSVIVPVYGVEKYIERCARSLFEQTLDDIEFLFIDDCTPDRSIEILQQVLEEYPQRKPQVIIHRMEYNSGQAAVRKWGMQNATGEYVIHCDSDDWVDKDMYRAMYEKAMEDEADVVVCDYVVSDSEKILERYIGCVDDNTDNFIMDIFHQEVSWSLCNKLFKHRICKAVLVYPENNMGEDMALVIQMLMNCKSIQHVGKFYYNYFYNTQSISKQINIDKLIENRDAHKKNVDIILSLYDKNASGQFKVGLLFLEYQVKAPLFPFLRNAKIRKYFYSIYPSLYNEIITNRDFPFYCKLKYSCALLGLYPNNRIITKLNNLFHKVS